nr:hypothetical protein [Candidatus Sigynarchaeota archaeon]
MPRKLRLIPSEGVAAIEVTLSKFTMEDLYGKKTLEKRTAAGETLSQVAVTLDGAHFLTSGSTSSQYIDESGLLVSDVVPTDQDGKKLQIFPDMFQEDVRLKQVISIEEYFTYNITKTYLLESEGDLAPLVERCQQLLAEKKFLAFMYAYYGTAFPEVAVLIPVDKHIIVAVGTPASLLWAKLNSNLPELFSEEESSEDEEPEFGEFW